ESGTTSDTALVEGGTFFPTQFDNSVGVWVKQFGTFKSVREGEFYQPGDVNPILVNYNNHLGEVTESNVVARNGQLSSFSRDLWGIYSNVGSVYNQYYRYEQDLYSGEFNVSFDLFPGGSERGRHNIQFGGLYEQR